MVVHATARGRVELDFQPSGWETAGTAITLGFLLTLLVLTGWKRMSSNHRSPQSPPFGCALSSTLGRILPHI